MADTKKTLDFQGAIPLGDASKYHSDAIVGFANTVDPTKVETVGASYEGVGKTFGNSLKTIQDMAQRLSESWSGDDASVEAQRHLALLYIAARTMQSKATQIGGAFKQFATGQPVTTNVSYDYGGYGTYGSYSIPTETYDSPISLSEFKSQVGMNADYFAGKPVAPVTNAMVITASDGSTVGINNATPANQRGLLAQHLLNKQNNSIFQAWNSIPETVTLDLPPALTNTSNKPGGKGNGNGNGSGGGGGSIPNIPGGGSGGLGNGLGGPGNTQLADFPTGAGTGIGTGTGPGGTDLSGIGNGSGLGNGSGTDLSGINPTIPPGLGSGGGTSLGNPGLGGGGTSLGTPPGLGTGLGTGLGDSTIPSSYTPGLLGGSGGLGKGGSFGTSPLGLKSGGIGSTGGIGSGATVEGSANPGALGGAAAQEAAAAAANAANAGRGGMMPMMPPMMGGAQGAGKQDRERSAWMTEDENIWGADDDVAPPLIG